MDEVDLGLRREELEAQGEVNGGRRWLDPGMEVVGLSFPAGWKRRQADGLGAPGGDGFL